MDYVSEKLYIFTSSFKYMSFEDTLNKNKNDLYFLEYFKI